MTGKRYKLIDENNKQLLDINVEELVTNATNQSIQHVLAQELRRDIYKQIMKVAKAYANKNVQIQCGDMIKEIVAKTTEKKLEKMIREEFKSLSLKLMVNYQKDNNR